ncbi:hypothetical protein, partial [Roseibium sediminicola]
TKRRRSSILDTSCHGIYTSRKTESVTHVSGTFCHLCLRSGTIQFNPPPPETLSLEPRSELLVSHAQPDRHRYCRRWQQANEIFSEVSALGLPVIDRCDDDGDGVIDRHWPLACAA